MGMELDYNYDDFESAFTFKNPKGILLLWLWYYKFFYINNFIKIVRSKHNTLDLM